MKTTMADIKAGQIRVGDDVHGLGKITAVEPVPARRTRQPKKIKLRVEGVNHGYTRRAPDDGN